MPSAAAAALLSEADRDVHSGQVERATETLWRATRLHPRLPPAYARLAELTGHSGISRHAAELAPQNVEAAVRAGLDD